MRELSTTNQGDRPVILIDVPPTRDGSLRIILVFSCIHVAGLRAFHVTENAALSAPCCTDSKHEKSRLEHAIIPNVVGTVTLPGAAAASRTAKYRRESIYKNSILRRFSVGKPCVQICNTRRKKGSDRVSHDKFKLRFDRRGAILVQQIGILSSSVVTFRRRSRSNRKTDKDSGFTGLNKGDT